MLDAFYLFEEIETLTLEESKKDHEYIKKQRIYQRTFKSLRKNGLKPRREWISEMRNTLATPDTSRLPMSQEQDRKNRSVLGPKAHSKRNSPLRNQLIMTGTDFHSVKNA